MSDNIIERLEAGEAVSRVWKFGANKARMNLTLEYKQLKLKGDFQIEEGSDLNKVAPNVDEAFSFSSKELKLTDCFFGAGSWDVDLKTGRRTSFKGEIHVGKLWQVSKQTGEFSKIEGFCTHDNRLASLFGISRFDQITRYSDEFKAAESALGEMEEIWVRRKGYKYETTLKPHAISLVVASDISGSFSVNEGSSTTSTTRFSFFNQEPLSYLDALDIIGGIEDLISLLALSPFSFQSVSLFSKDIQVDYKLLWHRRKSERLFEPEGAHSLTVPLMSPVQFDAIFSAWFGQTEHQKMAMILYIEAIKTDNSFAKFTHLAQAFEVLGRQKKSKRLFERPKYREILHAVKDCLNEKGANENFTKRIMSLISSSNKESYRDTLIRLLQEARYDTNCLQYRPMEDIAKDVAEIRNLLIHMSETNLDLIQRGFDDARYAGQELTFWFLLYYLSKCDVDLDPTQIEQSRLNHSQLYRFNFWINQKNKEALENN